MKKMRKGITLIEIVISLALLGIIIIGVFPLFSTTMKINQTNREKHKIHEEIVTEMESYRAKTYKEIIIGNQLEKTIDKGKYEIRTKIEFEQDPQISGNQSYGYLQLSIYAKNKETSEIIDEIKTYISNNGDDTTILIRARDEWKKESGEINWIENIQTELNNEYNGSKDIKTTDILGKTIYFNPPIGSYNVNLIATDYRESILSPNKENTTFISKKGCTTYQEYWMYKPINIDVHHIIGTEKMDIRLKTSQNETLIEETFAENHIKTAYSVRPLGDGNQSHYTIEAGFGMETDGTPVWKNGYWFFDKWTGNWGQYSQWYYNRRNKKDYWQYGYWNAGQTNIVYNHEGSILNGQWVVNPPGNKNNYWEYNTFRYWIPGKMESEKIYTPDYSANLYYKNTDNQWTQLNPKQLKLEKTVEGKFIFENGTINTITNKSELKLIVKVIADTTPINEITDNTIILTISQQ